MLISRGAGGHGGTDSPQRHGGRQVKKRQTDWVFRLWQRGGWRPGMHKERSAWLAWFLAHHHFFDSPSCALCLSGESVEESIVRPVPPMSTGDEDDFGCSSGCIVGSSRGSKFSCFDRLWMHVRFLNRPNRAPS